MTLELLSCVTAHAIQCSFADDMATGQQLRIVLTRGRLFCYRTNEDVVELEGWAQIDLARKFTCSFGLCTLLNYAAKFREFRDGISSCL